MSRNSLPAVEVWERKRVGVILRAIRDAKGLNIDVFANRLGRSRPFVANIEAGRKQLPPDLVPLAAEILGVDPIVFAKSGAMTEDAA